jgi:hypothetical protein
MVLQFFRDERWRGFLLCPQYTENQGGSRSEEIILPLTLSLPLHLILVLIMGDIFYTKSLQIHTLFDISGLMQVTIPVLTIFDSESIVPYMYRPLMLMCICFITSHYLIRLCNMRTVFAYFTYTNIHWLYIWYSVIQ